MSYTVLTPISYANTATLLSIPSHQNILQYAKRYSIPVAVLNFAIAAGHKGVTGGYTDQKKCAKGLVSEECGGNPVK